MSWSIRSTILVVVIIVVAAIVWWFVFGGFKIEIGPRVRPPPGVTLFNKEKGELPPEIPGYLVFNAKEITSSYKFGNISEVVYVPQKQDAVELLVDYNRILGANGWKIDNFYDARAALLRSRIKDVSDPGSLDSKFLTSHIFASKDGKEAELKIFIKRIFPLIAPSGLTEIQITHTQ